MDEFSRWHERVPSARAPTVWPADLLRGVRRMFTHRMRGVPLAHLVAMCEVGDILEFSGAGLAAALQEVTTASHCSHVGIVVMYRNQMCVLHATPHAPASNLLEGSNGLYICPLATFLPAYLRDEGIDIWLRKLQIAVDTAAEEPYDEQIAAARRRVNEAALEYARTHMYRPFMTNAAAFVAVAFPVLGALLLCFFGFLAWFGFPTTQAFANARQNSIYCSQTVAEVYERAGVFVKHVSRTNFAWRKLGSENVTPSDFTQAKEPARMCTHTTMRFHGDEVHHLPFAPLYSLGPEICAI